MSPRETASLGRNAPCWCNSGRKYKHCHHAVDTSHGILRLAESRNLYVKQWKSSSSSFSDQGCYDWMASQLEEIRPRRIFDVGCGLGFGLIELFKRFDPEQIISIDENRVCIESASELLRTRGVDSDVLLRMPSRAVADKLHVLEFEQDIVSSNKKAVLVESDLIIDPQLEPFLVSQNKFDAVTVWLIGTHFVRDECVNLKTLSIPSAGTYRLHVQNRVYLLADKILKPGGVLHVVDRGEPLSTDLFKQEHIASHCEQAEGTQLKFRAADWRYYDEPNNGVKMVKTLGTSGRDPNLERLAMVSIQFQKN